MLANTSEDVLDDYVVAYALTNHPPLATTQPTNTSSNMLACTLAGFQWC